MTIEEKRERIRLRNQKWREKDRSQYNQNMNKWRTNNPDKVKRYKLKERYNLTSEQYAEMSNNQRGCCAICGNPETATHPITKKKQELAVDHCHKTGKVRELLCQDCNRGIAKFQEDPVRLHNAIEYLTKHNAT